jgi:hypothetical protein
MAASLVLNIAPTLTLLSAAEAAVIIDVGRCSSILVAR